VLVLHVLMVWAFIIEPPIPTPLQQEVRVTLVLSGASPQLLLPPPRPPPLLTPRLAAIASPEVTILTPPPPSTTVPLAAPGPAMPAISPAPLTRKPPPEYLSRLAAYLNGFKNYPYGARQRREQGTVRLHFVMDRAGNVLSFQVAGSSGWSDLDDEARALILRAQPLPPVPRNYPGQTLDLIVPIVFSLR
jgi:protein TonB